MSRLLIRNARLVNEGQEFDADVLVANGRIEKIASSKRPRLRLMPKANGCCRA